MKMTPFEMAMLENENQTRAVMNKVGNNTFKMHRIELPYSVWTVNPYSGIRHDLTGYFRTLEEAKQYVDTITGDFAVMDVEEQEIVYCPCLDIY
jgi:hypothetical protein